MRTRTWWTLGAALVAVAALVSVLVTSRHSPGHPAAAAQTPSTPALTAPPPTAAPRPAPRMDPVAASKPTAFVMRGPAFVIRAHVCAMPYVRPLDPPGEQHHTVCWVDSGMGADFGVAPASPSRGTSYVLGHAWAEDPNEVLNPMSELAMRQVHLGRPSLAHGVPVYPVTDLNGYTIGLTTATGRLTYRVTSAFAVDKLRAGDVRSVMDDRIPNRLVLITCGVRGGVDVDVNVIAYATLVGAVANPA